MNDRVALKPGIAGRGKGTGDEEDFLERLRAGDAAASETLVRVNIGYLLKVAQPIVRDRALAEDCVQEAFINAFRNIESFEGRSSIRSWLRRITINMALMKLRSMRRRDERPIDDLVPEFNENQCRIEAPWTHIATPEEIVENADIRAWVRARVEEMPENYRVVLILRDYEELSTLEVAEQLEISEQAVRVRQHRARSALKKLLEPALRGESL
jgi:RNA polymerase sigma-70 factor (ECF subfamily)